MVRQPNDLRNPPGVRTTRLMQTHSLADSQLYKWKWTYSKTKLRLFHFIAAVAVLSILAPPVPIPGLLEFRLEDFLLIALAPIIVMMTNGRWTWIDLTFIGLLLSTLISSFFGYSVMGVAVNPRDAMELFKLIRYWLAFRLGLSILTDGELNKLMKLVIYAIGLAALIGLIQWSDWQGLGESAWKIYGQNSRHVDRVVGTSANPNDFAMLLVAGLAIAIAYWFAQPRKWLSWVIICLAGFAVVVTQSRSGLLGVIALCVIYFTSFMFDTFRRARIVGLRRVYGSLVISIVTILVIIAVGGWLRNEFATIQQMDDVGWLDYIARSPFHAIIFRFAISATDLGIGLRYDIWRDPIENIRSSPWLGWGPAKSIHSSIVDNEYLLYLQRYGVLGLVFYVLLYGQIFAIGWKLYQTSPYRSRSAELGVSLAAMIAAFLLANFFIGTFYKPQLITLTLLFSAVAIGRTKSYKHLSKLKST